ncbi:unnamed protein product [Sympodiomycopsis kandeliae]
MASTSGTGSSTSSKSKVATYTAPWPIYALAWSSHGSPSGATPSSSSSASGLRRQHSISSSPSRHEEASIPHGSRIAIGSLMEEYSNSIQVIGHIGERDSAGQPRMSTLASAPHSYPATKIAFQPSSLSSANASTSSSSSQDRERGYMSPNSKSAKRGSWGASGPQSHASPDQWLHPNDEAYDGYPNRELLASTADCLRIWECARNADADVTPPWEESGHGSFEDEEAMGGYSNSSGNHRGYVGRRGQGNGKLRFNLREKSVLAHSKSSTSPPAPLTSFSWNHPSPNLIVTSSIDTTCTVWDLPTRTALTQLIAHDREVYDVDWCPGSSDVFASVGADGSVRVFDLRSLEHSTIIYETAGPPPPTSSRPGTGMSTGSSRNGSTAGGGGGSGSGAAPLLRIAFNPWDANYLATFHLESDSIQILDVRAPGLPILELKGHRGGINAVAWGPPSLGGSRHGNGGGSSSSLGASGGVSTSSSSQNSSSSSISKGMLCTASDDFQVLVYDLASSTLRSASAQGRRSRNSNVASSAASNHGSQSNNTTTPSPAPSLSHSMSNVSLNSSTTTGLNTWGNGIPIETPFLAYDAPEMVNNVSWFRPPPPTSQQSSSSSHSRNMSSSSAVVQEWNQLSSRQSNPVGSREDWMACVAGKELRALRVG